MSDLDLDAIEARAKSAPSGSRCVCSWQMAQSRHIAASTDDVLALVAAVRALRAKVARVDALALGWQEHSLPGMTEWDFGQDVRDALKDPS